MADINVDVNLPSAIDVDITSPTQALATNISIPGPQGPRGPATNINNLSTEFFYITGKNGIIVSSNNVDVIYVSGNSGYFQSAVNSLTTNLESTGSNLYSLLNNFSGNLDATYATDSQLTSTGSTLVNSINSLSGYINSSNSNIIFTTGNQTVSGLKDFTTRPTVNNSGIALQNDGILTKGGFESFKVNNDGLQGYFWAKTTNRTDGNIGIVMYEDDETTQAGYSLLGVRNGDGFLQSNSSNFRIETYGGGLGNLNAAGADLNNSNLINATPQIINLSANFNISGNYNSRMIMVNSPTEVTGTIISGNSLGFNATIMQVGSGQVLITGSGIGITINEYANQYRTAGAFAAVTLLHTGSNGYVMYGNTAS